MNDLERFLAVCHGEKPDFVPIFGFFEAPGMAGGVMEKTYDRLVETGMPRDVGGSFSYNGRVYNMQGWYDYWGTTAPLEIDFFPGEPGRWPSVVESQEEGEYVTLTFDTGKVIRQLKENDVTYSMPDFITYDIRDRESFEYYKELAQAKNPWTKEQIAAACEKFKGRTQPLRLHLRGTWGDMRELMGPVMASTVLYDDPQLAHDVLDFFQEENRRFWFPVIECLKPEIVTISEDFCYNHGMFFSPEHFEEFCAPQYREDACLP